MIMPAMLAESCGFSGAVLREQLLPGVGIWLGVNPNLSPNLSPSLIPSPSPPALRLALARQPYA